MEYLGLLAGLALLIFFALRGINILFASVICSLVVIFSNGLPVADSLMQGFALGKLGMFSFAGKFFLLFASGAIFGRVMGDSQAATSIAMAMLGAWGKEKVLWIAALACALLTYGGVVVFVVIFAIYPLGLRLIQETNTPKRLFTGAVALGAGTFTMTALPGTPSIHNVLASVGYGTDLYAGANLGIFASAVMLFGGMAYLEKQRRLAVLNGEGFVAGPNDRIVDLQQAYPHWLKAIAPILVVLVTILVPRFIDPGSNSIMQFAANQPILWPCVALMLGTGLCFVLFADIREQHFALLGQGTQESVMPLLSTAAVIGFGGVVTQTVGFQDFIAWMAGLDLPPLLKLFTSVSLVAGITGSGSGGLQIFMQTMAPAYMDLGISHEILHRVTAIAAGGFDSLPHCGAIIAVLTITGMSHKQGYKDMAVVTVVIPVIACLLTILLASFM